jgi:hypothetical protein
MLSQAEGSRSVLRELDRRRFTIGPNDSIANSHIQQHNPHTIKKDKFAKPMNSHRFSMGGSALTTGGIRDSVGPQRPVQFRSASSVQHQQNSGIQDSIMTEQDTGRPVSNGNANVFATPRMARLVSLRNEHLRHSTDLFLFQTYKYT